eukprot:snap_masked-scaffold_4-processed-gene-21.67-mRNA-1 protein AED:1.00 eAED:1.00 QI:0/0/0/0/1/1/2/0/121
MVTQILEGIEDNSLLGNLSGGILFLEVIDTYLSNVRKYDVRLNVDKCNLFTTEAKWCGRVLFKGQWRFEDRYFNRILRVNSSRTMGKLEDVLYISIWLHSSIPQLVGLKEDLVKLAIKIKE